MPVIPMKQDIIVIRGGLIDEWGRPLPDEVIKHKARVDEGTFLVSYKAGGSVASREVVAKARILLDKLQDVRYDDVISYTNELNQEVKQKPKKVDVKRDFSSKPILTEVYI